MSVSPSPGVEALAVAETVLPPTPVLHVPLHLHVCVVDVVHKCVYTVKCLVTLSPPTLTWLGQQARVDRRQLDRQKTARKCGQVEVNVKYIQCNLFTTVHSVLHCIVQSRVIAS